MLRATRSLFQQAQRSLAFGLTLFACALLLGACYHATCWDDYVVSVDASAVPGATCTLTLSGPRGEASYQFPALPACDDKSASLSCTPSDASPTPDGCVVQGCVLFLGFIADKATALKDRLGATEFEVTASCDGNALATQTVAPQRQCPM